MVTGLGSNNVDKCKRVADDLNIRSTEDNRNEIVYNCSICLEPLVNKNEDRSPVTLRCEHQFHLGIFFIKKFCVNEHRIF